MHPPEPADVGLPVLAAVATIAVAAAESMLVGATDAAML